MVQQPETARQRAERETAEAAASKASIQPERTAQLFSRGGAEATAMPQGGSEATAATVAVGEPHPMKEVVASLSEIAEATLAAQEIQVDQLTTAIYGASTQLERLCTKLERALRRTEGSKKPAPKARRKKQ